MVETALGLGLIDRLIQLVTVREERKAKQFKELAQALFNDIEKVHADYLKLFEGARSSLISGGNAREIHSKFELDRVQYEPLRRKTFFILWHASKEEKFAHIQLFLAAASEYFHCTATNLESDTVSRILERLLKTLADADESPNARSQAVGVIDLYLLALRRDWNVLAQTYASLLTEQF